MGTCPLVIRCNWILHLDPESVASRDGAGQETAHVEAVETLLGVVGECVAH